MNNDPAADRPFADLRRVVSIENQALRVPDVDWDRVRERAFCSPVMLDEIEEAVLGTKGQVQGCD